MCILNGFSEEHTFSLYINGMDWNELYVDREQYLERGTELKSLLDYWLSNWWYMRIRFKSVPSP